MKRSTLVIFLGLAVSVGACAASLDTQKGIPVGCITVVTVGNVQADAGVSWMLDAWIKSKRQSPLKDLIKTVAPQEMSVAFFPESKDKPMYLLAVMALPKGAIVDKARIEAVIKEGAADAKLETASYKGTTIVYRTNHGNPTDFGAYALFPNQVVFGSDPDVIKKSIDGPSVAGSANYQKTAAQTAQARDVLLFADNAGSQFANFFAPREKKWKMTLLLSAKYLAYLGASLDVANSSKLSGTIVLQGADTNQISDIKDDAEFIGEAFKRKFLADKIQYSSKVEVKDATVTLTFRMEGLEPLWKKLFDQGVLELFRPES
jgi:hypothetical protein